MRQQCEGLWLLCAGTDWEPVTSGLAMHVIKTQPEFYEYRECDNLSVETILTVMNVDGLPEKREIHVCAEHFDAYDEANRDISRAKTL